MNKAALGPYLFLAVLYALVVTYLYAFLSIWYSDIPERVVFLQESVLFSNELIGFVICGVSLVLVIIGAIVMFRTKLINTTWLIVYSVVPLISGIILFEFTYVLTFADK